MNKDEIELIERESLENYPITINCNGFEFDISDNIIKDKLIAFLKELCI